MKTTKEKEKKIWNDGFTDGFWYACQQIALYLNTTDIDFLIDESGIDKRELIDKLDGEIMDWFYECVKINFDVDMIQDSSDLRDILERNL